MVALQARPPFFLIRHDALPWTFMEQNRAAAASLKARSQPFVRASSIQRRRVSCSRSDEHTSELQSLMRISYAVFCLPQKNDQICTRRTSYHKLISTIVSSAYNNK